MKLFSYDETVVIKNRALVLRNIFITLFSIYSLYLFTLQIIRANEFKSKAKQVARQVSVIPAQRGEIYDTNYNFPMVLNTDSFAIDLIPAELPSKEREAVFAKLAETLGMTVAEINKKIPPSYYHLFQAIEVKAMVPYEIVTSIAERINEFPGVTWHNKPVRNYLETGSLTHVIGYVGDITIEDLQVLYNQGYQRGDILGKTGIEKQYDGLLRGKDGKEYKTVDVKGKKIEGYQKEIDAPIMGANLILTIDRSIQTIAEKALGNRMGSVVVLKPATGEVLAMVSYPWYDPNLFQKEYSNKDYLSLLNSPNNPLINRSIQSNYPPASTFKILMSAGILEENAFPQEKKVDCDGQVSYGDRIFRCWIGKPGHGPLDLKGALAQSCNIYFMTVGREYLGIERMVTYAKEFGYGTQTGIDLPGEITGFVPTPQWKERKYHEKWLGGDTMNMAIGQGSLLVSPIQVANMLAMVVNGGTVYTPHILKEVRDPANGAIIQTVQKTVLKESSIKPEVFATVRDNMRAVVTEGSASVSVSTKAVAVAGKTGTAEIGLADRWHSWFASFGPYNAKKPEDVIAVVVIVEASNPWEFWSSYAANIIFQAVFANQTYEEAVRTLRMDYILPPSDRRE